jgi:hypothetical protein
LKGKDLVRFQLEKKQLGKRFNLIISVIMSLKGFNSKGRELGRV